MDNFLPGGFLQRPQTSGLDPMEFQFMPGPSPRAKPPQGKGSSSTHTTLDIVSLKPGAQTTPRSAAGLMMPPPCTPAEDSMEFSREMTRPWEGQNPSSNLISSSSHRRSLPRPEQSLNWRAVEGMRPPSRRRSATMGGISSHTSSISSLTVNPENASYQFKGDSVQSPREDETIEAKMAPATTSIATDTNQWGLDLLEMGFDLPEDIPSSAQKRDSIAISTSTELNRPKRKQARSLEFYETPQAKELETRLSELNSDKLVGKPSDNKIPEVIDLSDDDICFTLKQGLVEKPSSGRKVGNLIQQQQHKLREMQCHNEAPNHGRQERTLSLHSLHSSQGTVTPQPRHQPSLDAIQASRALQTVIQSGSCSLGQKSGSDLGTLSGEQQLSIALTHLAAEKTALEMKLSRVNQNYLQQSTELLTLKQENVGLRSENQKFKSAASSLRAQVSMVTEHVRVCGNDLSQLGEEAALLKAKVKGCIDDGIGIKQEIQKANMHTTSIAERIRKFEDPAHLVRDMELQRDQAQGTTSLLRKELNDIVGELSLARERVTTLETLLENAAQRTVKEKEQTEDVADILAEIKASCISGFEELQTLLKSILDANVGASAQASDMEKFLTCLVKTEVKEVVKKVNGVDNALKDIKQDMRQAEKRNRRVVLVGGVRVIDKLVTATEALEKLFRQECEGITKTVDDCLVQIRGDSTKQPEYIKAICNNLESVGERVKSIFTETKDIHNIAINDRKYISHLVGQNESLIERIKLLESKSEELAVLKINKIQVEKDLRESRDLCDRMSRELEGLKELGKENIKSIAYLEKQLEMALAMPKEDPSVIGTLRSTMENLDRSVESLLAMIADKEQQVVAKDRQIEALNAESLVLKKINEALKEKTGAFEEEREYESVLKRHYEEEKARYIQKALDERNTERISVEQNAQRLCEKIRVEAQNSMKMFRTDNTKLQSELLELRGKLTECEKSVVGYTQEVSQLHVILKASAEKEKEYQLQLSALSTEKAALESNLEAARDLVRNLENELETLRTSNFEEKLNQADLEVLSLKRDIDQMQRRVETGSGSLNLALNTICRGNERRELNRSLEDAIAEVQSLCKEISIRSSKKFVESGTCMDDPKTKARDSDSFPVNEEKRKLSIATIINDESQSPRRTEGKSVPNKTTPEMEDTRNITLIESTPPLALQSPLDSSTTESQPSASTRKTMGQSKDTLIELEECILATQTPVTKAQGKRKLTKAIANPETPSKTLQMLLGQSPRTRKKRAGDEPAMLMPPAQPRAKRPRYERPVAPNREVPNQKVSEAQKIEKIAGSATEPRAPSPTGGPKRKRAPTKRG